MARPTSLEAISWEPSPDIACTGLPIALAQSLDQRSPQRLSVAFEPSTTLSISAITPRTRMIAEMLKVRSEEHTSELQSQFHLVCRLLLEKKKITAGPTPPVAPIPTV